MMHDCLHTNCNPSRNEIQDSSRGIRAGNWQESADTPTMLCESMILLQVWFENIQMAWDVKLNYLKNLSEFANKQNSEFIF